MKDVANYRLLDGGTLSVEYDTEDPCRLCGLPVGAASVGGTNVCPPCDMGKNRDGSEWSVADAVRMSKLAAERGPLPELDPNNLPDGFTYSPPAEGASA